MFLLPLPAFVPFPFAASFKYCVFTVSFGALSTSGYAFLVNGGTLLAADDRLSFMPNCGSSGFISGLPSSYMITAGDNFTYTFAEQHSLAALLSAEPGMYRMCWCRKDLANSIDCEKSEDYNLPIGLLLLVGAYSGQVHTCTRGQGNCTIGGIRGVGLSLTDRVMPMISCSGYWPSQTWSFPPPLFPLLADEATGGYKIEVGELPEDGWPEQIQMCWCGVTNAIDCTDITWHFSVVVAVTLSTACAPGWYDLEGSGATCHPCPVGSYCPGGWPASLKDCPSGSTSVANSTALADCQCRVGYYLSSQNLCTACPAGKFQDTVGSDACDGTCPPGTTSPAGAISIRECSCIGDTIDTDPLAENFTCTDLMDMSANFSGTSLLASDEAIIFSFQGYIQVADASTEALLIEMRSSIVSEVGLTTASRVSSEFQASFDSSNSNWYLQYSINTSEEAVAEVVRAKFDPDVFSAYVYKKMKGTALGTAAAALPTPITRNVLRCPTGLAFAAGAMISGINNCLCPHGTQPTVSGSTGLSVGCVKCPAGKYKSAVADSQCTTCPTGNATFTTLSEGAISHAACTCAAGFVALDPKAPSVCQLCGTGFYCLGGPHREPCKSAQTTTAMTAVSVDECVCVAGFYNTTLGTCNPCAAGGFKGEIANTDCTPCAAGNFSGVGQSQCDICDAGRYSTGGAAACELCSAGRYLEATAATSSDACLPCPVGKWSNITGLSVASGCVACVTGSTTVLDGAANGSMCVQPDPAEIRNCTSGWVCVVEGVSGSRLQDGHRLAITTSDCASAKSPVTGIANNGISKLATGTGSSYVWGDSISDFTPQGGFTRLCWCANVGELTCEGLNSNFWLFAGDLLIVGPVENTFVCVRGRDCLDLQPFSGYGITTEDHVRIQRDSCGSASAVEISVANQAGTGSFQLVSSAGNFVQLRLGFGQTDAQNDFHVQIDANQAGYLLCWCGSKGSSTACANPADYVVYAGRLSILGPTANQEKGCAVGQECNLTGVLGASVVPGDRLMILSDCGRGASIPGFPGQGMLDSIDGTNFAFAADGTQILLSVPGIFRICFCRPITGIEACSSSSGFIARVGLMTASGPFARTTICQLGSACVVSLSGVGLTAGDWLWVADGDCGSAAGVGQKGFVDLQNPVAVEEGASGFSVNLSTLPFEAFPGVYQLCWCPQTAECSSTALFRAPGGSLQADCPPGSFATGPPTGWALL